MNVSITDKWLAYYAALTIEGIQQFCSGDNERPFFCVNPCARTITVKHRRFLVDIPTMDQATPVGEAQRRVEDAIYGLVLSA